MFKKSKHFLILGIFAGALFLVFSTISSQKPKNISAFDRPIIVDHTSIELFDQIPEEYLEAARNLNVMFSDRSVGQNVNEALSCLTASTWAASPASCRRDYYNTQDWLWKTYNQTDLNSGVVPHRIRFTPDPIRYNRDNWAFEFKGGSWSELTQDFIQVLAPSYINNADVLTYQFSYLNVGAGSDIANPNSGFFSNNSNAFDIYDLENYIAEHPTKTFVFWTSSLARSIGTPEAEEFNRQMRNYAIENNKVLLDMADILSHTDTGVPCYDNRDGVGYCTNNNRCENHANDGQLIPAICQDYTTETDGGHLGSVSAGKVLIAKAFWVMMAQVAGWDPSGGTYPTSTPQVTTNPTLTLTPTPTISAINQPPVVNDSSYETNKDTSVLISLSYTDSDGPGPYSVTITDLPDHGTVTGSGTNYTYTPSTGFVGADSFVWRVSDGVSASSATVGVRVLDPNNTPPTGVSHYWSFDESSTNPDVGECSGCTNSGATWTANGYSGGAFEFVSPTGSLRLGTLDMSATDQFTIALWAKPYFDETDGSWHYIFSQSNSINLFYLSNLNDFRLMLRTSNGNFRADTANLTWDPNTWHHVMITYNGSNLKLYWDGIERASTPATGELLSNVGQLYVGLSVANSNNFNGILDEIEVYPTALTPSQVLGVSTSYTGQNESLFQRILNKLGF